eukprot:CAMPEP_0196716888 /NCGR_PEP_ID=MMETSP1091-20130531/313_1 /TAXON_ID=302021 /ORGANISM="Rhodomonas sp., Strain CCMP768" /LENGTH=378 /DNA_ID=CAMNT_0042057071 /DNA_START=36 /DNA_END=1172 /DNA_ORIENTATION=-
MAHSMRRTAWCLSAVCVTVMCFSLCDAFAPFAGLARSTSSSGNDMDAMRSRQRNRVSTGFKVSMYGDQRVQVITDIDDTVKSSGGLRLFWKVGPALGGIDTQYKRGAFYPGVFQFGAELSSFGLPPNQEPLPMAVLTARARELKLFLALKPTTKLVQEYQAAAEKLFERFGVGSPRWGIDCDATVLYGSLQEWVPGLQYRKGWRKFDNFQKLQKTNDPDRTKYVLVGDTGEYDMACGESITASTPDAMKAMFFHVISEDTWQQAGPRGLKLPADRVSNGVPVRFFRTYVAAARKAHEEGLMDAEGLVRVMHEATTALDDIPRDDLRWSDVRRDVEVSLVTLGQTLGPGGKPTANLNPARPAAQQAASLFDRLRQFVRA